MGQEKMNTIEHRVKQIVASELGIEIDRLHNASNLLDIDNMDSLTLVETVMSLEEEFDTLMPDTDIENIYTLQDLIELCERKVSEKTAAY